MKSFKILKKIVCHQINYIQIDEIVAKVNYKMKRNRNLLKY